MEDVKPSQAQLVATVAATTASVELCKEEPGLDAAEMGEAEGQQHGHPQQQQQIYIIQTADGETIEAAAGDVVLAGASGLDNVSVFETVSALEQLSRGHVITTEAGELLQVYEEVVLPDGTSAALVDSEDAAAVLVDAAASTALHHQQQAQLQIQNHQRPLRMAGGRPRGNAKKKAAAAAAAAVAAAAAAASASTVTSVQTLVALPNGIQQITTNAAGAAPLLVAAANSQQQSVFAGTIPGGFHVCSICRQLVSVERLGEHIARNHRSVTDLTCTECGKLFKSKRSLFGHRKEMHSGALEAHNCPECGRTFGRKSNLKAHRESLHFGKKFPCLHCDRIFTNRSSMNQHVKKTHQIVAPSGNVRFENGGIFINA